jgi:glutamyl-tRNA synthetase
MEWNKFWAENKKDIDVVAKRYMAVSDEVNVTLKVVNAPKDAENAYISVDCHPKDPALGKRLMKTSDTVLIEKEDCEGLEVGEEICLMRWGVVKMTKVDVANKIFEGEYVVGGDVKAAKRKVTWLASSNDNLRFTMFEFDNLINKPSLEEGEDFKDFINTNNLATMTAWGDAGFRLLKKNEIIQIERRGYYRVDQEYEAGKNELHLFMIPDGKAKAMSVLSGSLAHH